MKFFRNQLVLSVLFFTPIFFVFFLFDYIAEFTCKGALGCMFSYFLAFAFVGVNFLYFYFVAAKD